MPVRTPSGHTHEIETPSSTCVRTPEIDWSDLVFDPFHGALDSSAVRNIELNSHCRALRVNATYRGRDLGCRIEIEIGGHNAAYLGIRQRTAQCSPDTASAAGYNGNASHLFKRSHPVPSGLWSNHRTIWTCGQFISVLRIGVMQECIGLLAKTNVYQFALPDQRRPYLA
jgi:hypothetical protein